MREKKLVKKAYPPNAQKEPIRVYVGVKKLPQGLLFYRTRKVHKLYAIPNYPTPKAPHVVISAIAWSRSRALYSTYRYTYQIPKKVRLRAKEIGANALFRPTATARYCYAIRMSKSLPPIQKETAQKLVKKEAAKLSGYKEAGETKEHILDQISELKVPIKSSHCYKIVFALSPHAQLGEAGENGILAQYASTDPMIRTGSYVPIESYKTPKGYRLRAPRHGRYIRLRSFTIPIGCALEDGNVNVKVQTLQRQQTLGTGTCVTQVLSKRISQEKLIRIKRKQEERRRRWLQYRRNNVGDDYRGYSRRGWRRYRRYRRSYRTSPSRYNTRYNAPRPSSLSRQRTRRRYSSPPPRQRYSVSLKNNCPRTVTIFWGRKPRYSSGTKSYIGSNNISSHSGFAPQTLWILDRSGNGVSSYFFGPGSHRIQITKSCTGFAPR